MDPSPSRTRPDAVAGARRTRPRQPRLRTDAASRRPSRGWEDRAADRKEADGGRPPGPDTELREEGETAEPPAG